MTLRRVTDLDVKLLRSFAEIVDRGGFAAAQTALNVSQSVLSGHVKTLEVRLGFVLCKRGPGGFKLLPEGERVYQAAKELFAAIDDFKLNVGEIGDEMSGELRIAVEDGIIAHPSCRLPQAFRTFGSRAGKGVRLRVETMAGYQAISQVADGTAHVAISVSSVRARDLWTQALFDEVVDLYCGASHPLFRVPEHEITPAMLASFPYASRGHLESKSLSMITSGFRRGDVGLGSDAHLLLVLTGRNLGFVPRHLASPFVQTGRLRAICAEGTRHTTPIRVVIRDSASETKLVALMRSCIVMAHGPAAQPMPVERGKIPDFADAGLHLAYSTA